MDIEMGKFGRVLTSRRLGKEAFLAIKPTIDKLSPDEKLVLDFEKVGSLSPSWADEFLHPLFEKYESRIVLKNTDNASVKKTIAFLREIGSI